VNGLPAPLVSAILDELPLGVLLLEPIPDASGWPADFRVLAMSRAAIEGLGASDAWLGRPLGEVAADLATPEVLGLLAQALRAGQPGQHEQHLRAAGSREGWRRVRVAPLAGYALLTTEDIGQQKRFEEHIRRMAFHDELTGIYNRRYFAARAPSQLALAKRHGWTVALLFMDLNGFKEINDQFGHREGDKVLQGVAGRLRSVSRESDLLFRSSGDEFALFLPEASEAAAMKVAARIQDRLREPLRVGEQAHAVGASIGVAVMPSGEASTDELLERADAAMYAAKARKREEQSPAVLWSESLARAKDAGEP
jgi:diguanylate cyclase (GGDEF)-like protein